MQGAGCRVKGVGCGVSGVGCTLGGDLLPHVQAVDPGLTAQLQNSRGDLYRGHIQLKSLDPNSFIRVGRR